MLSLCIYKLIYSFTVNIITQNNELRCLLWDWISEGDFKHLELWTLNRVQRNILKSLMQNELHTPHRSVKVRVLSWNVVDRGVTFPSGVTCLPCSQRLLDYLAFQLFDFELPDKELYLKRFGCDALIGYLRFY